MSAVFKPYYYLMLSLQYPHRFRSTVFMVFALIPLLLELDRNFTLSSYFEQAQGTKFF